MSETERECLFSIYCAISFWLGQHMGSPYRKLPRSGLLREVADAGYYLSDLGDFA